MKTHVKNIIFATVLCINLLVVGITTLNDMDEYTSVLFVEEKGPNLNAPCSDLTDGVIH